MAHGQNYTTKRPFYVIGHMANDISDAVYMLDQGANALEFDISFFDNGTVNRVYHGVPCDCFRICTHEESLPEYLSYIRKLTDPQTGKYSQQLTFQFFDLKLQSVSPWGKYVAGSEIANHVIDYLWGNDTKRQLVRVLIFINDESDQDVVLGVRNTFLQRGMKELLDQVGFDGGTGTLKSIRDMWHSLGIRGNLWQGDGIFNCLSEVYKDDRLREALQIRDSPNGFINKVYHWTIDSRGRMRMSLHLGVDGMITNLPEDLIDVLNEDPFSSNFRIATPKDNPFSKFHPGKSYK